MIILGIDTSSNILAVGLVKDGQLLGEISTNLHETALQELIPVVDNVLQKNSHSINEVDLFTVVLGPGLWSGIRIGVTTAKGFAHALQKPIVGISALDALAYNFRFVEKRVYSVIDAKRGQVYFAGYSCQDEHPKRFTDYSIGSMQDFLYACGTPAIIVGDSNFLHQHSVLHNFSTDIVLAPPILSRVRGAFIAEAGLYRYTNSGPDDTLSLAPLYLQEVEAEKAWRLRQVEEKG